MHKPTARDGRRSIIRKGLWEKRIKLVIAMSAQARASVSRVGIGELRFVVGSELFEDPPGGSGPWAAGVVVRGSALRGRADGAVPVRGVCGFSC